MHIALENDYFLLANVLKIVFSEDITFSGAYHMHLELSGIPIGRHRHRVHSGEYCFDHKGRSITFISVTISGISTLNILSRIILYRANRDERVVGIDEDHVSCVVIGEFEGYRLVPIGNTADALAAVNVSGDTFGTL